MKKDSFSIMIRMWHLVKKYRTRFYVGFLVGSTSRFFFRYLESFLTEKFTEACLSGSADVLMNCLKTVLLLLLFGIIVYPASFGLVYTTYSLMSGEIKKMVFDKMLKINPSYIESHYSGELITRVTTDYNDAIQLIAYPVVGQGNAFSMIFGIVMIAIVILYKNFLLGGISLVLTIVNFLVMRYMLKPMRKKERRTKEFIQNSSQSIVDSLSGMMVSKMFGLTRVLVKRYQKDTEDIYQNNLSLIKNKSLLAIFTDMQSFVSFTAVCAIGLFLCTKGLITIPVVLFISLMQMALGTFMRNLSQKLAEMQKYIEGARRLFEFLDAPEEELRPERVQPDFAVQNVIELEHIQFRYQEAEEKLFEDLSLSIANKEKIGIAGGSGGGKTTLMKLLLEFVEQDGGTLRLFGNDVHNYSQVQVRGFFSYVPQDCYLFDGTIRENIMFGNYGASEQDLLQAVENACLKEFIDNSADGLETRVGERGTLLSGGQRQRVAIARAFLKNAPILLLDEATSALDSQSEEIVQRAIEQLMKNRTSIVIAHRLSTIQDMDRILVMEAGHIVEAGTHTELLQKEGRYYELYHKTAEKVKAV